MNKAELRQACERIAPGFRVDRLCEKGERIVRASCVYRGQVLELSMVNAGGTVGFLDAERSVLEACLDDLRRRETTRAA